MVFGQQLQFLTSLLPLLKTTVFGAENCNFCQKLWFLALAPPTFENLTENCSFWLKTVVFGLGSSHIWKPHWKLQFSAKNHGCWSWLLLLLKITLKTAVFNLSPPTLSKTMVFSWKLQFLVLAPPSFENHTENCSFQPKPHPLYQKLQFSATKSAKSKKSAIMRFRALIK